MRERLKDKLRLEHILSSIDVLMENKNRHKYEDVVADPIMYFGFVKHVEIIGEAVYMLSEDFKTNHPEVDWEVITGMRHVLVHGYYKIKPHQLWDTIEYDIAELRPHIQKYFDEEP